MSFPILKHLLTSYPSFIYDKKQQKLHKNFKVFRKISVLYISRYSDLVNSTTKYHFRIEIVDEGWGKNAKNTESEGFNLTLGVKSFIWAFVG